MSQVLRDARLFEEEAGAKIPAEHRPGFHLCPRAGWMNDPNGFSYYNGQYHLFYQYHPYDSHWGPMHWGHAVSPDLLRWTYLPAALAPDMPYDRDGCFSGGAVTLPDGRQLLMYTGVRKDMAENGEVREVQTQCLAAGDGLDYRKYEHNPVLTEADLPAGGSRYDFRDPRIWREPDGSFRALIANDDAEGGGQLLLFSSDDGFNWHFRSKLVENHHRIGTMWECPDLFRLDGKDVVLLSAQDMLPKGFEYHNGNGSFYMLGSLDAEGTRFTPEADFAADYGIDFYAPQTVLTPDGRRVMIGWLQNWDTCIQRSPNVPWFGQMSLPRELSIENGRMYQRPLRELEARRGPAVVHRDVLLENNSITLPGVSGRMTDLEIELRPAGPDCRKFSVNFAENELYHTGVSYRFHESVLKIDRKFSGSRRAIIHQRRAKADMKEGVLKLRLILDRFSAEVFVNDGEKVMSAAVNTDLAAQGISFRAEGKMQINVTYYDLK